ncbi:hypothetical protein [Saccharopolyspora hattusasensis]|uniref:hypothetical protein n=1 Tax=Saccharopolyspora hattusasensis TaxID=1128679 RepID=UPI003D9796BC
MDTALRAHAEALDEKAWTRLERPAPYRPGPARLGPGAPTRTTITRASDQASHVTAAARHRPVTASSPPLLHYPLILRATQLLANQVRNVASEITCLARALTAP